MERVREIVDQLYKNHFGKMVAALTSMSRDIDLETAEDIVQDSFSSALATWQKEIPSNPAGWIYAVGRNKALNWIKRNRRSINLSEDVEVNFSETKISESVLNDYQLKLLFACAHPSLAPKIQVVITLKYVVNFKVDAIAKVFAMSIDGVDKLLVRARQKIKDENILFEEPDSTVLTARLSIVHKILYLIFNEGYKSSSGKELIHEELCEDALIMCKVLLDSTIGNKETTALYSLMLLNSARFASRFSADGELIDLEHQDRAQWNKDLILLGHHYLIQSQSKMVSTYHIEASIAYIHCSAETFEATNWRVISDLYARLLECNPNPFVELNFAIALYYSGKKEQAFEILNSLRQHPFLSQYSILNSALGKLHGLEGRKELANKFLKMAMQQTGFEKEKRFIEKMFYN